MAAREDVVDVFFKVHEAAQDIVQHRIGRQGILVLLVRAQLGRGRLGDDPLGDHIAVPHQRAGRHVGIAPFRQFKDFRLVEILQRIVAAAHVAVERRVADRHLALVAGGHDHVAELVRQRHQRHRAQAGLDVLFRDVRLLALEGWGEHPAECLDAGMDVDHVILAAQRFGAGFRVFQTVRARIFRRHHHAPDLVRPQRVGGNRRGDRRVDAARHAEHHTRKLVLAYIVPEALHRRAVFRRPAIQVRRAAFPEAHELLRGRIKLDQRMPRLELADEAAARAVRRVGRIGGAVEDQLVLPAHLVDEQVGQAKVRPAVKGGSAFGLDFAAPGRGVRHQQQVGPGGLRGAGHALEPDVLADGEAEAHALEIDHHGRAFAGGVVALLVEHAVVRQLPLVMARADLAAFEEQRGIVQLAAVPPGRADQDRGAVRGVPRQLVDRRHRPLHRRRLQHQVLRRIAEDEMLAQHHKVRALGRRVRMRGAGKGQVPGNITDHRIKLRREDSEIFAHTEHLGRFGPDVMGQERSTTALSQKVDLPPPLHSLTLPLE